ncbi:MAG: hypothetical protein DRJ37_01470 [Thermoprotei archaeon]|nr:MAG: hypothetical protein DRJ37_01470 [Thermoprotei archaeon]
MLDRFMGAMLGASIGDALGAYFEGWRFSSTIKLSADKIESKYLGVYTDDTEMTIILAESIIKEKRLKASLFVRELAAKFNPRRGYGYGTMTVLRQVKRGVDWREATHRVFEGGSYGNGGCIRVAPVSLAYYDDKKLLLKAAEYSCIVTHSHPLGIEGCLLQAYAISLALKSIDKEKILNELLKLARHNVYLRKLSQIEKLLKKKADLKEAVHVLGNFSSAPDSMPLALYLFLKNNGFENTIIDAIRCGGDTDSIAAMAGALAGAYYGYESIPRRLVEKLEDKDKILELARKLWKLKREAKILEPML